MNVLVTGGAGYVGGAVTDLLMQSGHNVRVYDALLYEESYRKDVDFVYGDVRDTERLLPQLKWADAVIWLAALVGDGACALNPEISVSINQETVKWLTEHFDGRIIFMSTCSVYGAQDAVLDEYSPVSPLSVYAATKLASEQYLEDKNAIIFRLGTLFGVSDKFARIRFDLVVNTLTVRAHQQGKITVFGGDQFRPLLHVRDAARMAVESIDTKHRGIFNIARQNVRIIDLAYQVRNHFPDLLIEQTPMMFQDARNYRASSEKAQKVLGFKSAHSIDDGIEEVKELLETHRLKDANNPRYTNQTFLSMFNTHKMVVGV
ncbi:MAG: SDR family oxidoreductase [Chloroflexi bacterium]|nr:SDR family oxidoreductase [Chloroflexota bacterium]